MDAAVPATLAAKALGRAGNGTPAESHETRGATTARLRAVGARLAALQAAEARPGEAQRALVALRVAVRATLDDLEVDGSAAEVGAWRIAELRGALPAHRHLMVRTHRCTHDVVRDVAASRDRTWRHHGRPAVARPAAEDVCAPSTPTRTA